MNLNRFINKRPMILRSNIFFLNTLFWRRTLFNICKAELVCLYISRQLSVFPNNLVRVCPIKLRINMLCHMNSTFQKTFLYIFVAAPLKCFGTCKKRLSSVISCCCCDLKPYTKYCRQIQEIK